MPFLLAGSSLHGKAMWPSASTDKAQAPGLPPPQSTLPQEFLTPVTRLGRWLLSAVGLFPMHIKHQSGRYFWLPCPLGPRSSKTILHLPEVGAQLCWLLVQRAKYWVWPLHKTHCFNRRGGNCLLPVYRWFTASLRVILTIWLSDIVRTPNCELDATPQDLPSHQHQRSCFLGISWSSPQDPTDPAVKAEAGSMVKLSKKGLLHGHVLSRVWHVWS